MADLAKFFELVNNGRTTTLKSFSDEYLIDVGSEDFTLQNLYDYEGNSKRIEDALRIGQKKQGLETPINHGVLIRIPINKIERTLIDSSSNVVLDNNDFEAFLDDKIKDIIHDVNYVPVNFDFIQNNSGKVWRMKNKISVWIYCKGLGKIGEEGKLINVTPFVKNLTTNVGDTGGNFKIELAPISASFSDGEWKIQKDTAFQYAYNGELNFVSRDSTTKVIDNETVSRLSFFHNVIKSNDLVFIKFETLESERKIRGRDSSELTLDNLIVDKGRLVGGDSDGNKQIFDMIGLVDSNSSSHVSESAESDVEISGRDLMKVLLEDGEYFYPNDITGKTEKILATGNSSRRRLIDGSLNHFNAFFDRTIGDSIKFLFNIISSIKVVDGSLFNHYGDERTMKFEWAKVTEDSKDNSETLMRTPANGIYQIIKVIIDKELEGRRIADSSIATEQGNLFSYISGKLVQEPFAEFFGDTYGNQYYFIARKPPFDKKSYSSNAKKSIDIESSDVYNEDLIFDDSEVYSWYRLNPMGNYFGGNDEKRLDDFPAVFFEEYAEIWGSRPLDVTTNYIDYLGVFDVKQEEQVNYMIQQGLQDLDYLIQTNAYKPFTRKGTLVIKGDRRIKRGTTIRYKLTGEIFHVDNVTNTYSIGETIDRVTSIQVSRGMIEDFVHGKVVEFGNGSSELVSYFNIIDCERRNSGAPKEGAAFILNKNIFQFFLKNHQFNRNGTTN